MLSGDEGGKTVVYDVEVGEVVEMNQLCAGVGWERWGMDMSVGSCGVSARVGVIVRGVSVDLFVKYACSVTVSVSCEVMVMLCKLAISVSDSRLRANHSCRGLWRW